MSTDNRDEVLTAAEVAKELHCSKAQVCKIINGKIKGVAPLPALRLGRRTLVRRSTLELWKKDNESEPGGGTISHRQRRTLLGA